MLSDSHLMKTLEIVQGGTCDHKDVLTVSGSRGAVERQIL